MAVCPPLPPAQLGCHWMDFHDIRYLSIFFENVSKKFHLIKIWRKWGVLYMQTLVHVWQYLAKLFLEWEIFETKVVWQNKKHFVFSDFFPENRHVYEIIWESMDSQTDRSLPRYMHFASWITKATNTHSEYVIIITFPRQQWLLKRTSMSRLSVRCLSFHGLKL